MAVNLILRKNDVKFTDEIVPREYVFKYTAFIESNLFLPCFILKINL